MNKNNIWFLIFSLLILSYTSCKKENTITPYNPKEDLAYYPMTVGSFIDYSVKYVFWNDFTQTVDTTNYILREFFESIQTSYSGDTLFRIERYTKNHPDSLWDFPHIWYCGTNDNYAFKVEENIKYVKIITPVKLNSKWDGNAYNDFEGKQYKYTAVDENKQFGNLSFNKCITILQQDYETLINQDFEQEIYAFQIGLIYKKQIHVNKTYNQITQRFEITSGYLLEQTISNYGTIQ